MLKLDVLFCGCFSHDGTVTQRFTPVDLRAAQLPGADSELRLWGCGFCLEKCRFSHSNGLMMVNDG